MRIAVASALLAAACCPRPWPKALVPLEDVAAVSAAAARSSSGIRVISADAKVDAFTREGRGKVRVVIVADRAGRLRFETLSPFEQPLSTLVSDGERFALYDLGKKVFYRGKATPENVSRILPIRMRGEDLARLLMGEPPRIAADEVTVTPEKCETRYRIRLVRRQPAVEQDVWVDAERLVWLGTRVKVGGELLYQAAFEEHRRHPGGAMLPTKIRYKAPGDKVDILLVYADDATLNEKPEDEIFRLEPPRGAAVQELD